MIQYSQPNTNAADGSAVNSRGEKNKQQIQKKNNILGQLVLKGDPLIVMSMNVL